MTTLNTDLVIRDAEYYSGMVEILQQETEAFNAASNGAITLVNQQEVGHFHKEAFFKNSVHIGRRVTTDTTNKVATKLTMDEHISAKLHRSYMAETTRDSFRKLASDIVLFSIMLGQMVGKEKAVNYLNTAILSARSAMAAQALINHTVATPMDHTVLVDGRAKFGDRAQRIAAWVMHSGAHTQLMHAAINVGLESVAGVTITTASAASLGIPVIVTDSPALINGGNYVTLGLVEGAVNILETEGDDVVNDVVTGQGNLIERIQGEHAFNVGIKGFGWVEASGQNPDDAALGVAANYVQSYTDHKSLAGVVIQTTV